MLSNTPDIVHMVINRLTKREPKLKYHYALRYFFFLQSQIVVWTLKRMRTFLLSLRMRMIREHAQTYMVRKKWWIYLKRCP